MDVCLAALEARVVELVARVGSGGRSAPPTAKPAPTPKPHPVVKPMAFIAPLPPLSTGGGLALVGGDAVRAALARRATEVGA